MVYRAKAPLRLGLAGGGTDVSPYSDLYGGYVLNAAIGKYAYCTIIPKENGEINLFSIDRNESEKLPSAAFLDTSGALGLLKGVYNRVAKDFARRALSFELYTYVDAPIGSGLGSSSTLAVAVLGAFAEWLKIPLGEYDIAQLAYHIEREDLSMNGGKQDQYAAVFGGINFMEFYSDNKVVVNPLRVKREYLRELEFSLLLFYTGTSRLSSAIIDAQSSNARQSKADPLEAMHQLKNQALQMKEKLLRGELDDIGKVLDHGWQNKKRMAEGISNPLIDEIYETALAAGATGGKISGAGGGGFMMFYCPGATRYAVIKALARFGGELHPFQFVEQGLERWTLNDER